MSPDIESLVGEAHAFAKKKDWAEALERYRAAVALDPNNPEFHFLEGCCWFKMNRGPAAREAWSRCLKIDPSHEKARVWIRSVTGMPIAAAVPHAN